MSETAKSLRQELDDLAKSPHPIADAYLESALLAAWREGKLVPKDEHEATVATLRARKAEYKRSLSEYMDRALDAELEEDNLVAALRAAQAAVPVEWQPIETAPRDGTVFLARNADHPGFGVWPMLRRVRWVLNEGTLRRDLVDDGCWLHVTDNTPDLDDGTDRTPYVPFSVAPDEHNRSVRYEWVPLNPIAPINATPAPAPDVAALVEAAQWARNRLESIADAAWHGDGRDLKRALVGVFADFDDALAKCGSSMPEMIRSTTKPLPAPDVAGLVGAVQAIADDACSYICPSTGKADTPIPHAPRCVALRAALAAWEARNG